MANTVSTVSADEQTANLVHMKGKVYPKVGLSGSSMYRKRQRSRYTCCMEAEQAIMMDTVYAQHVSTQMCIE